MHIKSHIFSSLILNIQEKIIPQRHVSILLLFVATNLMKSCLKIFVTILIISIIKEIKFINHLCTLAIVFTRFTCAHAGEKSE